MWVAGGLAAERGVLVVYRRCWGVQVAIYACLRTSPGVCSWGSCLAHFAGGKPLQIARSSLPILLILLSTIVKKKRREFVGKNCCAGPGSKVDAPELSSGPGWKIQEASRAGAQRVTSKSKLLAREMPDLHNRGLWADPGAVWWLKGARAGWRVDRRGSYASV